MLEEHGRTWKNSNPPLDAKPYDWAGEQFGEQHHAGWQGRGHAMASMASLWEASGSELTYEKASKMG